MLDLFKDATNQIEVAFRELERLVPKPSLVTRRDNPALRYVEETLPQAIILKLARYVSGLRAGHVLFESGFLQELAVIQRTLDEIHEDIVFLQFDPPPEGEEGSGLRDKYLKFFWQEEFEEGVPVMESTTSRYNVQRSKIRNYIDRLSGAPRSATAIRASEVIFQTMSGFLHAAAPQVIEMCEGPDRTFLVSGMLGTHRMEEHEEGFWNQHYRGLITFRMIAVRFGQTALADRISDYTDRFEAASGTTYMADVRAEAAKSN